MLLIRQGNVHTMEDDTQARCDLLLRDGRIAAIAPQIRPEPGMTVLEAAGMEVYPGLIDAHSHIGISEEKAGKDGDDCNEGTTPLTPFLRAVDAIDPMDSAFHNALATGITGVMAGPGSSNPVGGQFAFLKTDGRRLDDMLVLAPAAIKVAFGENPKTNYGLNGNMPSTRMGIAGMIREELFRAREYLDGKGAPDFRLECYRDLFDGKIPLKAHVHRADDIFTAIRIAKEFHLGLTLDHCTEGHLIAHELAELGYPAIVGPSLASRSKLEVSQSDFRTAGILHKAGVRIALTTDHPVSRIQHLPLCAALAAREGLGKEAAMRAITLDAAIICRVDGRVGSLKTGKDADAAIFDGSPLDVFTTARFTILDGRIAYQSDKNRPGLVHEV